MTERVAVVLLDKKGNPEFAYVKALKKISPMISYRGKPYDLMTNIMDTSVTVYVYKRA